MTVVGESGLPHDAGRRDSLHHRERLRKKITEQLKERIGEEDIVASGPEKKIRVPVKGTKRWQFIFDRGQGQGVGGGDGKPGDVLGPGGDRPVNGEAGTEPGEELYEVWLDMNDVEELLFSELQLPRLKAKTGTTSRRARRCMTRSPARAPARQEVDAAREPPAQRQARPSVARRDR